jgi:hypothetical protein
MPLDGAAQTSHLVEPMENSSALAHVLINLAANFQLLASSLESFDHCHVISLSPFHSLCHLPASFIHHAL